MTNNLGSIERGMRVLMGLALLAAVVVGPRTLWGLVGLAPLVTGLLGHCPLYALLGVSTSTGSVGTGEPLPRSR